MHTDGRLTLNTRCFQMSLTLWQNFTETGNCNVITEFAIVISSRKLKYVLTNLKYSFRQSHE